MYHNIEELLTLAEERQVPLYKIILENEMLLSTSIRKIRRGNL